MDIVNFSEGILGIDQNAAPVVAKCLRESAKGEDLEMNTRMNILANFLECGWRIDIKTLRQIGETPLSRTQRLFLNAS